jgi:hypothetical protein
MCFGCTTPNKKFRTNAAESRTIFEIRVVELTLPRLAELDRAQMSRAAISCPSGSAPALPLALGLRCNLSRMHQRRSQRAERLTKHAAHSFPGPYRRTCKAIDSARGVRVAAAQNGALHKNRPLRLRESIQPVTQRSASCAGQQLRDFPSGKGSVVLDAGTSRIRSRQVVKRSRVVQMHNGERPVQHSLPNQPSGGARIGARVDLNCCHCIFHQAQSFRFIAQHQRGKTVHLHRCVLCFKDCFAALARTRGLRHQYHLRGKALHPILAEPATPVKWPSRSESTPPAGAPSGDPPCFTDECNLIMRTVAELSLDRLKGISD